VQVERQRRVAEFDKEQPYHDIKDIIEVKASAKKNWWWMAGGGLFVLLVIIYLLTRKKRIGPAPARPAAIVDPFREAMSDLQNLSQAAIGQKEYYTRLTDILRNYLFRRKGILSLQETTGDLIPLLKNTGLSDGELSGLRQSLLLSDFVKFAKYQASAAEDGSCFDEIGKAIQSIERVHQQSLRPKDGTGGSS